MAGPSKRSDGWDEKGIVFADQKWPKQVEPIRWLISTVQLNNIRFSSPPVDSQTPHLLSDLFGALPCGVQIVDTCRDLKRGSHSLAWFSPFPHLTAAVCRRGWCLSIHPQRPPVTVMSFCLESRRRQRSVLKRKHGLIWTVDSFNFRKEETRGSHVSVEAFLLLVKTTQHT